MINFFQIKNVYKSGTKSGTNTIEWTCDTFTRKYRIFYFYIGPYDLYGELLVPTMIREICPSFCPTFLKTLYHFLYHFSTHSLDFIGFFTFLARGADYLKVRKAIIPLFVPLFMIFKKFMIWRKFFPIIIFSQNPSVLPYKPIS